MTLGDCIKEYRDSQGLSQRQFAELCGLSNAYISILEKNVNPKTGEAPVPTFGVYQKVAMAMGINVQTLMERCPESKVSIGSKMTAIIPQLEFHPDAVELLQKRMFDFSQDKEEELTSLYRSMTKDDKEKLLDYARYIATTNKRRK